MSDSDEDDVHFCLRCKGTFIGLDVYIEHRKAKCKRDDSEPVGLELHFPKDTSTVLPSGSESSNRASWSLEGLQNSSPSVKEDSRLEDALQPDILEINRKDEILDTFLPSSDNDPCLKAVDFFSILELQSSKSFHDLSAQKSQAGMVTRSKSSAVLQAKKSKDPIGLRPFTHNYQFDPYHSEHSQYVVGKDVIIADNFDFRKEDVGPFKEKKLSGLDSPKSKSRSEDIEDDGKSESDNQFPFQEVHNEVTIACEGNAKDESDTYSEESEEDDEEEEDESRRISIGGKWKPGGNDWATSSYWSSTPPANHTGGKWKPMPPPALASSTFSIPSTSSTSHEETYSEPQSPIPSETSKRQVPSPSYTRGKWLPTIDSPSTGKSMFWCGPCNRRLSSQTLYEKHCQTDLHRRRTCQENQLEEDFSADLPRAMGKREVKRTQTYIHSDLWSKSKRKRLRQASASAHPEPEPQRPRGRGATALHCTVCQCRVWPHLIGKHLVSHFHCRRARSAPELAAQLALRYMSSVVHQAPFQCALCKFFCNTMSTFLQHWISKEHVFKDGQVEGRYCCPFCRTECGSSSAMYQHLLSERHKESIAIINGSVPIIIQKKTILKCNVCEKQFRYNIELRHHAKTSDHIQEDGTGSDKYQEREACEKCDFVAFSRLSMQRHLAQAHKDIQGRFFCSCCDATFPTAADAKAHRASAEHRQTLQGDQDSTRVCCHCYSVFSGVGELKRHLKDEHPEMAYRCIRCGSHFTLKQELARHVRLGCKGLIENTSTSTAAFQCSKCGFTSNSEAELLYHLVLQHEDPLGDDQPQKYRCPSCPRAFLKSSLKKHLLSHTGERPYICRVCGSGFARKDVLESHVFSVHSLKRAGAETWEARPERQKTESCTECGASFYDKTTLQQHRQIHEGKQFKCDEPGCVYAGRSRGELRNHLLSHSGDRPFRCEHCGFAAKTKNHLIRHGRSHLDSRTHHCPHCPFTCNSSTHLKRHLRLHTGAKPFHCPHCDFSCNLLENLRKHVLSTKKHPGKRLYSCHQPGCSFGADLAKDFRVHLVTIHGQTASAAASFVTGLYRGAEDPRHVDEPLTVPAHRKKRRHSKSVITEEDALFDSHPKSLVDNPTLASAVMPGGSCVPSRPEELLQTVVISEPSDDVICIELPADDGLDGYDGTSFFSHGDTFQDMGQRALFEGLHRSRTVSLAESAVMLPLGSEDMEDHTGLIVIDEGTEGATS